MANEFIINYLENSDLTYEEKSEFLDEFNKLGNSLFVNFFIDNTYHPKHIITAMKDFNALDNDGKSELLYELMEGFYKEYPVDIHTFIHDPEYLGEIYDGVIYPIWDNLLKEIYPAPLLSEYSEVILSCATRCHGKGTRILMYDGSTKNVEDIIVGDLVMGDDSKPRKVKSLARGKDDMYRVTPNKGSTPFTCNKEHILSLKERYGLNDSKTRIVNLTVMDYLNKSDRFKKKTYCYKPKSPVVFENTYIPKHDPYLLGLWLADGRKNRSSFSVNNEDLEIIDFLEDQKNKYGCDLLTGNIQENSKDYSLVFNEKTNPIHSYLRDKNVFNNKHVPYDFKIMSVEDRLLFLAGYLDGDGNKLKGNATCYACSSSNKSITEGILFIVRSLGLSATYKHRSRFDKRTNKTYEEHSLIIGGDITIIPVKLNRKKIDEHDRISRNWNISSFEVEYLGVDDYYGFELDGNHLYLLEDFTVTHNSGKTTIVAISFLYEMYKLMCMMNPAKDLAGKATARLVFAVLSKDDNQAIMGVSTDIEKALSSSPFFINNVTNKLAFSSLTKSGVEITDYMVLKAGSAVGSITGSDLYCGCLDEANMPSTKISTENLVPTRLAMYRAMLDRKEATFKGAPAMSGIIWMVSSPTDEGDVIGERIKEINENDIRNVKILDNIARWEARTDITATKTFKFFIGSDIKDPHIVENEEDLINYPPDKVLTIPYEQEYYTKFKSTPYLAMQEIAGRRTVSECSLFSSTSVFAKIFNNKNDIFSKDIIEINFEDPERTYDNDKVTFYNFEDYLINKDYFKNCRNKDCYRYIHLDIASKKDRFGMSSVYSNLITYTSENGKQIKKRIYYVDFCLGITAKTGQAVDILKALDFVCNLRKLGYPIKLVTTDSHQGILARQHMAKKSIKTEYLSVEISKDPYVNLKNLIVQEELIGFEHPELIKELRGLKDYPKKIGKSKGYTDDLSDSLAGALYSCTMDKYYKNVDELILNFPKNFIDSNTPNAYNGVDLSTLLNNNNNTSSNFIQSTGKLGLGY